MNSSDIRTVGLSGESAEKRAGLYTTAKPRSYNNESIYTSTIPRSYTYESPSALHGRGGASLGQREILSVISPNFANVGSAKRDTRPSIGHAPPIHLMPISREARPLYNETSTLPPETTERVRYCAKDCRLNLTLIRVVYSAYSRPESHEHYFCA